MPDDSITQPAAQLDQALDEWLACQRAAEAWIAPAGKLIEDRALRNRRISAAYASLWLADHRFQWAGLAAFASKQVGCGLQNAADTMQRLGDDIRAAHTADSFEWLYKVMIPALVGTGAGFMRGQLSLGNLTVFLDAYPLHRFYIRNGIDAMRKAIGVRHLIADRVHWPVASQLLPFGKPFREIMEGFELIEAGQLHESVAKLAWHEQVNVLQTVMYNDPKMRLALDSNQIGTVAGQQSADFEEVGVSLDASCHALGPDSILFSPLANAHLYDVSQRMAFVMRAAARMDEMLRGAEGASVAASLRDIAALVDHPVDADQ
ncbi:hypothetical protein NX773_09525 [Massilia solisilvae]|uniref:Uncharacterized protein n=1 Tax=Massilia solisilvae TaxID=1811225 RepID=A0ABT2BJY5_9BURK|nr:hypothetical protein [Massilia solisilvae]MCS0608400.1 hypothetical protein [Massilia solisilvae]